MKLWHKITIAIVAGAAIVGVCVFASLNKVKFKNEPMAGVPTLLTFGSETCPPCRQLKPVLKRLEDGYTGRVNILYADLGTKEGASLDRQYRVSVTPTLIFIDADGNEVLRTEGFRSQTQIELDFRKLGWTS